MRKKSKLICVLLMVMILSLSFGTISAFAETQETMPQLIAHYEFEDEANLGKDSTANGNHLIVNNSSQILKGKHGMRF